MSEAKALLIKALELIRDPAHWTQGTFARNAEGYKTVSYSPTATCFCSIGAILSFSPSRSVEDEALRMLEAQTDGEDTLANFNDNHTHAEVIAVWERAIL